jgi:hypothetical protein
MDIPAGGMAPSPASHHPSGGGLGQFIKDTLTGPAAAAEDEVASAAAEPADTPAAAAAAAAAEPAEDVSSAGSELSTDEQFADELFHNARESSYSDFASAAAESAGDTAGTPADITHFPAAAAAAAAPEVLSRPSRSYSGEGVGQHEPGPAAAAAAARLGSGGLQFGRAYSGPGLAMQPDVQVGAAQFARWLLCVLVRVHLGRGCCQFWVQRQAVQPGVQVGDESSCLTGSVLEAMLTRGLSLLF